MTRATEARWRGIVRDQERSGLTVREFAAERGLSGSTVFWWRSRLRQKAHSEVAALVPVEVVGGRAVTCSGSIELDLGGGVVARIPSGFDEADLARLLRVLGKPC